MDKLQFHFKMLASQDTKSNILCITKISTTDNLTYVLPHDSMNANHHKALAQTSVFIKIKNANLKRGQTRKVWITLSDELKKIYFDKEGNLQFNNEYLEEDSEINVTSGASEQSLITIFEKLLEKSQEKNEQQINIGKIAKEFTIDKFDGKNSNVTQWISNFEKECDRFNITTNDKKIEILKSFMGKSALDWYSCTLLKLTIEAEWKDWRDNFCNTFASKGWTPIRYAMQFKYQTGSLIEYSIKKEKLLLQVRSTINNGTLIDLIATGLPSYISDKIDREKLDKTEDLHNEIGKLEHLANKKPFEIKQKPKPGIDVKSQKTLCTFCKENKKGVRYHPESECWFKNQETRGNKTNQVNNLLLGVDSSEEDPKN
ncbi:uncharacterized protein [Cardiocondyla obscurior]|uniref:uncharacterized protein n=1 Tax=Cardiocondyla obscurior TaxID=286306 RepID=UPI0039657432